MQKTPTKTATSKNPAYYECIKYKQLVPHSLLGFLTKLSPLETTFFSSHLFKCHYPTFPVTSMNYSMAWAKQIKSWRQQWASNWTQNWVTE